MKIKPLATGLMSAVIENFGAQILVAQLPFASQLLVLATGWSASWPPILWPVTVSASFGFGLALTGCAVWFKDHSSRRREHTVSLARAFYKSDIAVCNWLKGEPDTLDPKEPLRSLVQEVLDDVHRLIEYRIDSNDKGVSFLVLEGPEANAKYDLYASVNHDSGKVRREIHGKLSRDCGFASEALQQKACLVLKDCKNPPPGSSWVVTYDRLDSPRFRGRAAAPVICEIEGVDYEVGALCFDIRFPRALHKEDQELLYVFAEKIAALWSFFQVSPSVGVPVPPAPQPVSGKGRGARGRYSK